DRLPVGRQEGEGRGPANRRIGQVAQVLAAPDRREREHRIEALVPHRRPHLAVPECPLSSVGLRDCDGRLRLHLLHLAHGVSSFAWSGSSSLDAKYSVAASNTWRRARVITARSSGGTPRVTWSTTSY